MHIYIILNSEWRPVRPRSWRHEPPPPRHCRLHHRRPRLPHRRRRPPALHMAAAPAAWATSWPAAWPAAQPSASAISVSHRRQLSASAIGVSHRRRPSASRPASASAIGVTPSLGSSLGGALVAFSAAAALAATPLSPPHSPPSARQRRLGSSTRRRCAARRARQRRRLRWRCARQRPLGSRARRRRTARAAPPRAGGARNGSNPPLLATRSTPTRLMTHAHALTALCARAGTRSRRRAARLSLGSGRTQPSAPRRMHSHIQLRSHRRSCLPSTLQPQRQGAAYARMWSGIA